MATGCRGAGSKTEGLGPFYLLPGEKEKHISRSCKASRISHCTGGEEQVGCPEAQTSSKLLGAGWEKLVSSGDGSAAPWPNQPPLRAISDHSKLRNKIPASLLCNNFVFPSTQTGRHLCSAAPRTAALAVPGSCPEPGLQRLRARRGFRAPSSPSDRAQSPSAWAGLDLLHRRGQKEPVRSRNRAEEGH